MSDAKYASLTKSQKRLYWLLIVAAGAFIGYMWFFY